jgi:hypothetical protein
MKFVAGGPALGSSVQLSLSSPQDPYALAFLGVSGALLLDSSGCGLALPGIGELLIGVQPFPLLLPAGKFTGTGALTTGGVLPSDLSFVGLSLHLQGLFVSATQPLEPVRLTNAISIDIGL